MHAGDAAGPRPAEMVPDDPADVAVVTNITADHFGMDGISGLDDLAEAKALVAGEIRPGTLILNGDDPRSATLARRPAVLKANPMLRYFSLDSRNPIVLAHRLADGARRHLPGGRAAGGDRLPARPDPGEMTALIRATLTARRGRVLPANCLCP